jgi:hypothetical protein
VLATNHGLIGQTVRERRLGFLYAAGDKASFFRAIDEFLASDVGVIAEIERNLEAFSLDNCWPSTARQVDLYVEALKRRYGKAI